MAGHHARVLELSPLFGIQGFMNWRVPKLAIQSTPVLRFNCLALRNENVAKVRVAPSSARFGFELTEVLTF